MKKDSFMSEFVQVPYHAGDVLFRYELNEQSTDFWTAPAHSLCTLDDHWMVCNDFDALKMKKRNSFASELVLVRTKPLGSYCKEFEQKKHLQIVGLFLTIVYMTLTPTKERKQKGSL